MNEQSNAKSETNLHPEAAWIVQPNDYLDSRPPVFDVSRKPQSRYLTMRDGCRLAIDVWLPQGRDGAAPPAKLPTILVLTPYYRRFALKQEADGVEPSPNTWRYREVFVPRGYAVVVVDVRGTGASFGTRDSFRSPRERGDYAEIADWIVAQDWSDGQIGATGISYLGAAALFLASTGHPAVRAVAPLFAVWDTYSDHYYPGGILLNRLAESYDYLMVALDQDRRELLERLPYFSDRYFAGPCPVDEDSDGALCRSAVKEHHANFRMPDFISEFRFRDDCLPYDPTFGSHSFSPYNYAGGIAEDVAVYSVSGWMDGAGFSNGAIACYLSLPNRHRHLLLGPWDHGARVNVSPWRDSVEPRFNVLAEILRFFDTYLMRRRTGLEAEAPIHYYTIHQEEWCAARQWPPVAETRRLFLKGGQELGEEAEEAADHSRFAVDFTFGTGTSSRYERLAALDTRDYYCDWKGRDDSLLSFNSPQLEEGVEITGHPVLTLWVSSSEGDAALHAYLSEVQADGSVCYVTEGVLRALHRQECPAPAHENWTWPYRSFMRRDAAPAPIDAPFLMRFALLPTSWRFAKGSRVRLAIGGADGDHYVQVPHGRPPVLTVHFGGAHASSLELPWRETSGLRAGNGGARRRARSRTSA